MTPSVPWRILLTATLQHPLDVASARAVAPLVVEDADLTSLHQQLGGLHEPAVAVGISGHHVVVAADHAHADGLGLLTELSRVLGVPVTSGARGVGDRPDAAGPVSTVVRRLAEVAVAPPARVPAAGGRAGATHDTYVQETVPGRHATADVVTAAVRTLARRGVRRRVAVAVGVAREVDPERVADRSALLRLRDAERLDRDAVATLLRSAPTQAPPGGSDGAGALTRLGLRVLGPRLGSTLLVSHLGLVDAPAVEGLAFHPVTAGGGGLSLGASTLRDDTTLTLRARGKDWGTTELAGLLEEVAGELGA